MGPRFLQQKIHSEFSNETGVWNNYRQQVYNLYTGATNLQDYNDHLLREFNKKIIALKQPTGLMFTPYDAGFRFLGGLYGMGGLVENQIIYNGIGIVYNGEPIVYN